MFKIFNEIYYVDIDAIDEYVQFTAEVLEDDVETEDDVAELKEEKQIHLVKYELVKNFLETVLTEANEVDEDLGMKSNEVSIPFKIAFNSLLIKKIINKI
jgi:4-alpha-glucanotransferase